MKRLFVALVLVLMTSWTALAHGGFGFRISLGFPLFYPSYYSYPVYGYPAYGYPVTTYRHYEPPRAYEGQRPRTVIENYYVNGELVERRIKTYNGGYDYDRDRYYGR